MKPPGGKVVPKRSALLITRRQASKREPIREAQAQYLALLIGELIDETRIFTEADGYPPPLAVSSLNSHHTYILSMVLQRAVLSVGISNQTFRCSSQTIPLASYWPMLTFPNLPLPYTLFRAEAWSHGLTSSVQEALNSGALAIVQAAPQQRTKVFTNHFEDALP